MMRFSKPAQHLHMGIYLLRKLTDAVHICSPKFDIDDIFGPYIYFVFVLPILYGRTSGEHWAKPGAAYFLMRSWATHKGPRLIANATRKSYVPLLRALVLCKRRAI